MRSGTVDLPSGRWHWTLVPQWTGATVIFQHRERVHDEMRSWTPSQELETGDAMELALDAVERTWMDVDGLKWRLSLELSSEWRRQGDTSETARSDWLVFKRGGIRKWVRMPEGRRLGELSHGDLKKLLEEAHR